MVSMNFFVKGFLAYCFILNLCFSGGFGGGRDSGFRGRDSFGGGGMMGGRPMGGSKSMMAGESLRKPTWDLSRLPRFEKHFYKEHPSVTNKTEVKTRFIFVAFFLSVLLLGTEASSAMIIVKLRSLFFFFALDGSSNV